MQQSCTHGIAHATCLSDAGYVARGLWIERAATPRTAVAPKLGEIFEDGGHGAEYHPLKFTNP